MSVSHNPISKNVMFSLNFPDHIFGYYNLASFLGSARKFHDGDIVLAVPDSSPEHFLEKLVQYDVVIYLMPLVEVKGPHDVTSYYFDHLTPSSAIPLAQIRYIMYQYWALKYHRKTNILTADFRDVFFQSNPFVYNSHLWKSKGGGNLVISLEFFPNKVIGSCPFNFGWIQSCYGDEAARAIAHNPVSCSGVTIGPRNMVLLYSYLQTLHMDPSYRRRSVTTFLKARGRSGPDLATRELWNNDKCYSKGMDQGIHNWLFRSGELKRTLGNAPSVFYQGEGPVNTIGAFQGHRSKLKLDLEAIGLIKLTENSTYTVHNWNGDLSPVVHQYDRTKYRSYFEQEKVLVSASRRQYIKRGQSFPYSPL